MANVNQHLTDEVDSDSSYVENDDAEDSDYEEECWVTDAEDSDYEEEDCTESRDVSDNEDTPSPVKTTKHGTKASVKVTAVRSASESIDIREETLTLDDTRGAVNGRSKPSLKGGNYDSDVWDKPVLSCISSSMMTLPLVGSKVTYDVPKTRVNKALLLLDPSVITVDLAKGYKKCTCSRQCHRKFSINDFSKARLKYLQAPSEIDALNALARQLQRGPKKGSVVYKCGDVECCPLYFSLILGISSAKLYKARELCLGGGQVTVHSKNGMTYETNARNRARCVAYWKIYFDTLCQVVSDTVRLRPTNLGIGDLYELEFKPFMQRGNPGEHVPGLQTFRRALKHPQFHDVTKQTKHNHCRCTTCAGLSAEKMRIFRSGGDTSDVMTRTRAHADHVKSWRETEAYYKMLSEHSPHLCNTIMCDDTSAIGFPHFTNRPVKSTATKRRVEFIPWLVTDHSRSRTEYVYTLKGKYKKGANRYCTMLYHVIKAIKTSGTTAAMARELVLIGDNYAENKNNVNLAFASDLIKHNW